MKCSLNLHLRSAHEKPHQPNRFDSPTDPALEVVIVAKFHKDRPKIVYFSLMASFLS